MFKNVVMASVLALAAGTVQAAAQSCGGNYEVRSGDTLSTIADRLYQDARKWSLIYDTNRTTIGSSPNAIRIGQVYRMPCIAGLPVGLAGAPEVVATTAPVTASVSTKAPAPKASAAKITKISLLTGGDYAPFTDKASLNEGLATDIVQMAMEASSVDDFKIHWVNDWASHLEPLLSNAMLDAGFPWFVPDCVETPTNYRCENFLFSEPLFEVLVLAFQDNSRPLQYTSDSDLIGRTFCRPEGYSLHMFDYNGRNWLKDGLIELKSPRSVADCFNMLVDGDVDAVVLNEFVGRTAITNLNMSDQVSSVPRPLSIDALHLLVHKTHPQAQDVLSVLNEGLTNIKTNGQYQQIVDAHMSAFWESL
jgi:polar amino acid transport system substrate-binding protein